MQGYRDPIFKGCTRPAMFAGVPMLPFLLVTGCFLIATVWTFYLVSGYFALFLVIVYVPICVTMRQVTKKDDQRLHQLMKRVQMRLRHGPGRSIWGATSYAPLRYKKR